MALRLHVILFALVSLSGSAAAQADAKLALVGDESADFQVIAVLSGLDNPTGVVLRPTDSKTGAYELFVAESGAGRVLRVSTDALQQADDAVVGFPVATLGAQEKLRVGPLALAFVTRTKLAVSVKGETAGHDFVGVYALPADGTALLAAAQDHVVGPLNESIAAQIDDLYFGGMAMGERTCYVTTGGGANQGWILKSAVQANRLASLQPFIDLTKVAGGGAPCGITAIPNPRPPYVVVGLMGSHQNPGDSRLVYFEPASGELALELPTGLHDIVGLAYSPSGQLYAADFSWHDEQAGGVYRLDDARANGRQACRAVKIASIVRPYGLAFTPDGTLFVTSLGEGDNTTQGALIQITGKL